MIPTHIDISVWSQAEVPCSGTFSQMDIVMCQVTSVQSMVIFYEPKAKIFDICRKTAVEFMEFQVIPQKHYQTLET